MWPELMNATLAGSEEGRELSIDPSAPGMIEQVLSLNLTWASC